jgi:hypothetical protein
MLHVCDLHHVPMVIVLPLRIHKFMAPQQMLFAALSGEVARIRMGSAAPRPRHDRWD